MTLLKDIFAMVSSHALCRLERAPYPWFMIMILIVTVGSQAIVLVIGRVARYALVRVYSLHLGADSLLFYRGARRFRAEIHS